MITMRVIAICGEKSSGKDSMANFAIELLVGKRCAKASLADPLKEFCTRYLDIPREYLYGSESQKNEPIGYWGDYFREHIAGKYGKVQSDDVSTREVMQVVGTDIFRASFSPTFWVDIMLQRTIPYQTALGTEVLLIPDVRFRNEVEALQQFGATLVRLHRSVAREEKFRHESEVDLLSVPAAQFDYVVPPEQNGSLDDLLRTTRRILGVEGLLP
jgi:hypothetical protein